MDRIQLLQNKLRESKTDALLITNPMSIKYLIGHLFHPGERFLGMLVYPDKQPVLVLNRLFPYEPKTGLDLSILPYVDGDDVVGLLMDQCKGLVAVDNLLPASILLPLLNRSKDKVANVVLGSHFIDGLRLIKDEEEKKKMRAASKQNDSIMKQVESFLRPGISDLEVEQKILDIHKELGVEASFPPIVAFKVVASDPHGSANGQVLGEHDCAIIDMGTYLNGYCSDMTRTFLFGDTKLREIYEIVLRANKAAIAAVRPGVRFCDVDRAARSIIEEAGYGEYFTHRTGHGIGMEIHEPVDVSAVNEELLRPGMCFSIEPGVYLPGVGGVRIEDLVIVTETGVEVLNSYPK